MGPLWINSNKTTNKSHISSCDTLGSARMGPLCPLPQLMITCGGSFEFIWKRAVAAIAGAHGVSLAAVVAAAAGAALDSTESESSLELLLLLLRQPTRMRGSF